MPHPPAPSPENKNRSQERGRKVSQTTSPPLLESGFLSRRGGRGVRLARAYPEHGFRMNDAVPRPGNRSPDGPGHGVLSRKTWFWNGSPYPYRIKNRNSKITNGKWKMENALLWLNYLQENPP